MANQQSGTPRLSIVIPAYNEEMRLPTSLRTIAEFVKAQDYAVEVILVNNNSTDQTHTIALAFAEANPFMRVLFEGQQGKGAAIRTGMLAARGHYRFICDADLSMPIEEVNKFLPPAVDNFDIAIGTREGPGSQRYDEPWYRHMMGRVFNTIVRLFAVPGFQDTQCGFKMFTAAAAEDLFPLQTMDGWSFDVELLHAALRRGHTIVEVPINWYYRESSRIHPIKDSINMFRDVLKIKRNGQRGMYD